jgi:hypothetical protein
MDADVAAGLRTIDDQLLDRFGEHYRLLSDVVPGVGSTITLRVPVAPSHRTGE